MTGARRRAARSAIRAQQMHATDAFRSVAGAALSPEQPCLIRRA